MKRRYEFRARLWQSLSVVAVCAAMVLMLAGCGEVFHQPKHTGPVTVALVQNSAMIMERANHEIFVMQFHNEHPWFETRTRLADVLYEDNGRDQQWFVKAVLASDETLIPTLAEKNRATFTTCPPQYWCSVNYQPKSN